MKHVVACIGNLAFGAASSAPAVSSTYVAPALPGATMDASDLYRLCTTDQSAPEYYEAEMYCRGYVVGAVDTTSIYSPTIFKIRPYCVPVGTPTEQVTRVVAAYLSAHPEERRWSAATEVFFALKNAFPCAK